MPDRGEVFPAEEKASGGKRVSMRVEVAGLLRLRSQPPVARVGLKRTRTSVTSSICRGCNIFNL